jgi:hypothetical protein
MIAEWNIWRERWCLAWLLCELVNNIYMFSNEGLWELITFSGPSFCFKILKYYVLLSSFGMLWSILKGKELEEPSINDTKYPLTNFIGVSTLGCSTHMWFCYEVAHMRLIFF